MIFKGEYSNSCEKPNRYTFYKVRNIDQINVYDNGHILLEFSDNLEIDSKVKDCFESKELLGLLSDDYVTLLELHNLTFCKQLLPCQLDCLQCKNI